MEEQKNESQQAVEQTETASQQKPSEVKVNQPKKEDDEVVKYRSLQSRADKADSEREKIEAENKRLHGELIKQKIVHNNPLLEGFLKDVDFSHMSEEEADQAAENLTKELNDYNNKRKAFMTQGQQNIAPQEQKVEAPSIESGKSSINSVSDISDEQFAKLSRAEQRKFLQAKGLL